MTLRGLECPVQTLRCSLRSFSLSSAEEPWYKSALITTLNLKLQALNTKPLADFLFLREFAEFDSPDSDGLVIEAQSQSLSEQELSDGIFQNKKKLLMLISKLKA